MKNCDFGVIDKEKDLGVEWLIKKKCVFGVIDKEKDLGMEWVKEKCVSGVIHKEKQVCVKLHIVRCKWSSPLPVAAVEPFRARNATASRQSSNRNKCS